MTVRSRTAAQKCASSRELVYQEPQVEPIYICCQSQRGDGQTKTLSGQVLKQSLQHLSWFPALSPAVHVCYVANQDKASLDGSCNASVVCLACSRKAERILGTQEGTRPSRVLSTSACLSPQDQARYEQSRQAYPRAHLAPNPEQDIERERARSHGG